MSEEGMTAVGFKLSKLDAENFEKALAETGLTKSGFFRACVCRFLSEDREEFLRLLGFEKRFFWQKTSKV